MRPVKTASTAGGHRRGHLDGQLRCQGRERCVLFSRGRGNEPYEAGQLLGVAVVNGRVDAMEREEIFEGALRLQSTQGQLRIRLCRGKLNAGEAELGNDSWVHFGPLGCRALLAFRTSLRGPAGA
jgi:hypothetical protein